MVQLGPILCHMESSPKPSTIASVRWGPKVGDGATWTHFVSHGILPQTLHHCICTVGAYRWRWCNMDPFCITWDPPPNPPPLHLYGGGLRLAMVQLGPILCHMESSPKPSTIASVRWG